MSKLLPTLPDGKVYDFIDQKIRNDTPEEYVRQNIERRLVLELGYLPEQIEVEYPIKQGRKTVRVDLAIFREGEQHNQENIWIVIECKKDSIPPSTGKDGVEQLKSHLVACDNSEWGLWTNGKQKTVLRCIRTEAGIEYEEPNDIPSKDGDIETVDAHAVTALENKGLQLPEPKIRDATGNLVLKADQLRDEAWHQEQDVESWISDKPIAPAQDESNSNKLSLKDIQYDPNALPIWELAARIAAKVPDGEWAKVPADLSQRFDYYQGLRDNL